MVFTNPIALLTPNDPPSIVKALVPFKITLPPPPAKPSKLPPNVTI
ncbi:MAG: hypothetical protein LN546_01965 [Rickettsia endosymbiont of Ecitomorpha arachnoides]|nr:hypothetical protein [Rickettsia endosymbiont of Ecitomorpha arachnoides]